MLMKSNTIRRVIDFLVGHLAPRHDAPYSFDPSSQERTVASIFRAVCVGIALYTTCVTTM
jgi:hypothetical protein